MKKEILSLLLIATAFVVHAQYEVYANASFFPQGDMKTPVATLSRPVNNLSIDKYSDISNSRTGYTFGVGKTIIPRLKVGLQYTYYEAKGDVMSDATFKPTFSSNLNSLVKVGDVVSGKWQNHSILITGSFDWLRCGRFKLYSKAGVGVRISKFSFKFDTSSYDYKIDFEYTIRNKNKVHFAYEVMPVGLDLHLVGPLSVFAEGGYGTAGCLNAGVKASF